MRRVSTGMIFQIMIFSSLILGLTVFAAPRPADPRKVSLVTVEQQVLYAVDDYTIIYEFDVVTGRPEKETTSGKFKITKKIKDYTSKKYKAQMPYTMFFTQDGKAIHGTEWATLRSYVHTYITESVGSHGCVGLTREDAESMFEWAPTKTRIVILEEEPDE